MDLNQSALPPVFAWNDSRSAGMSFYFTSACARCCPVLDPQTLKMNPMCFTALTERILAGLLCEQGCDFCQHLCLCVSQSCNNYVQLLIISVAMLLCLLCLFCLFFYFYDSLPSVLFCFVLFYLFSLSIWFCFSVWSGPGHPYSQCMYYIFLFCVHAYAYIFISWEKPVWLHFSGMHLVSTPLYIKYAASWKTATYCA